MPDDIVGFRALNVGLQILQPYIPDDKCVFADIGEINVMLPSMSYRALENSDDKRKLEGIGWHFTSIGSGVVSLQVQCL